MAKKLTDEMVIARTKISDLSKIKRLNCWGSELADVSILRRMPSVEVLSLSINRIESLEDFQYCKKLEELYIRQNNIQDLNEVYYLKDLPNLKNLWLGENPCANVEGYRLAVLWVLPRLQKLDNVAVTAEEIKESQQTGKLISHPDNPDDYEEHEEYNPKYRNEETYSSDSSPRRQGRVATALNISVSSVSAISEAVKNNELLTGPKANRQRPKPVPGIDDTTKSSEDYELEEVDEYYPRRELRTEEAASSPYLEEKSSTYNNINEDFNETNSCGELHLTTSLSANSLKEYLRGERHHFRQSESTNDIHPSQVDVSQIKQERRSCSASHRPPFNRRPVTRNSNILSAVLCLVKELDYPSLEVVEMAVRCRMDELDE